MTTKMAGKHLRNLCGTLESLVHIPSAHAAEEQAVAYEAIRKEVAAKLPDLRTAAEVLARRFP